MAFPATFSFLAILQCILRTTYPYYVAGCVLTPGKKFFDQLDRDKDGRVTMDDIRDALAARKLPVGYAKEFFEEVRGEKWWLRSLG